MRALTKQQRGAVYLVIATVLTGVGRLIEPGVFVASGTKWYDLSNSVCSPSRRGKLRRMNLPSTLRVME